MCVGKKQRGVKRMAQLHNPFSPWIHFSWHHSITSWPYLQINNYWKNVAGPHMRIFHSRGEKLCVGWWFFIFTRGSWVCCHVFRAPALEVLSLLSLQRLQEELRVGTSWASLGDINSKSFPVLFQCWCWCLLRDLEESIQKDSRGSTQGKEHFP